MLTNVILILFIVFMLTTFFGRAKKVVRKKPAPELRSLIICNAQPEQNNSLRSDRFCFDVVSHTMITHYAMGIEMYKIQF